MENRRIAVIGAGPMGLAAAYELISNGMDVTLFERDDRLGGMSSAIDFDGTRIERYYHFICVPDLTTFEYLRELGLDDKIRWARTRMAYYYNGSLYEWGNPFALLKFPALSLVQKVRYGLHVMRAKAISDWRPYDRFSSTEWLHRWIGSDAYDVVWKSLFHHKFYEYENDLSAAWLGTRIKRVALSRTSMFSERLGYLEGGSETLIDALGRRVCERGVAVRLATPIEQVVVANERVVGLRVRGAEYPFDAIVSTIPLRYLSVLAPQLPRDEAEKITAIKTVGVVCVLLKLRRPFTDNFWMNINDARIEIPGLIEYTNLNPLDGTSIVYAPYYMPHTHPKYRRTVDEFIGETVRYMKLIRPGFDEADILATTASRYDHAQTVCPPGFLDALPPMRSKLRGLFAADTSHYYPEDRSISESLRIGKTLGKLVMETGE